MPQREQYLKGDFIDRFFISLKSLLLKTVMQTKTKLVKEKNSTELFSPEITTILASLKKNEIEIYTNLLDKRDNSLSKLIKGQSVGTADKGWIFEKRYELDYVL